MIDLDKIRFGDSRSKNEMVSKLYKASIRYCIGGLHKRGADVETAKDIFHEGVMAFIVKVEKDPSFILSTGVKNYLYRICLYKYIDQTRKRKQVEMSSIINDEIQDILDDSIIELERKRIIECLMVVFEEKLKEECQIILKAFYFYQKSLKEIADMRGITTNSAKTQKSRCLSYLRKEVVDLERINTAV